MIMFYARGVLPVSMVAVVCQVWVELVLELELALELELELELELAVWAGAGCCALVGTQLFTLLSCEMRELCRRMRVVSSCGQRRPLSLLAVGRIGRRRAARPLSPALSAARCERALHEGGPGLLRHMGREELLAGVEDAPFAQLADRLHWLSILDERDVRVALQDERFHHLLGLMIDYCEYSLPQSLQMALIALARLQQPNIHIDPHVCDLAAAICEQWTISIQQLAVSPLDQVRFIQALTKLKIHREDLLVMIRQELLDEFFASKYIPDLMAWFAVVPSPKNIQAIQYCFLKIQDSCEELTPYKLLLTLRTLKTVSNHLPLSPALLETIYNEMTERIFEFKPIHLSPLLSLMTRLGGYKQKHVQVLTQQIALNVTHDPELPVEVLVYSVDSLTYVQGTPPEDVLGSLFASVKQALPALTPVQLVRVLRAVASFNYQDIQLVQDLCQALRRSPSGTLKVEYLCSSLYALAALGYEDKATISYLVNQFGQYKPGDLHARVSGDLVLSLAHFQIKPTGNLFSLIAKALVKCPTKDLLSLKSPLNDLGLMSRNGSLVPP
eukprot:g46448.t1